MMKDVEIMGKYLYLVVEDCDSGLSILFHTGLRIFKFCGLTIKDLDMKNRIINIDHQLQKTNHMEYHIESTKTNAGIRKLPMTEDVCEMFKIILVHKVSVERACKLRIVISPASSTSQQVPSE